MRQLRCAGVLVALLLAGCALDGGTPDGELDGELDEAEAISTLPDLTMAGIQDYSTFYRAYGCNTGPAFFVSSYIYLKSTNLTTGQVASQIGWHGPFSWYANVCNWSAPLTEAVVSAQYPSTYDLVIDSTNLIAEANETNNTVRVGTDFMASFLFREYPDYRFQYCNVGQTPITPTSSNLIKMKLTNKTLGASASAWAPIPAPQECLEATLPCSDIGDPTCTGAFRVKAQIDSTSAVVELNESNNKVVVRFAPGQGVGTPEPDDP